MDPLIRSAPVAALYDLMLMLDPTAPEERHEEIVRDVRSMIESDGSLIGVHDWGTRRLAYEIDHRREAGYHLFQFEGERPLLERIDQRLKIMDGVLRFRTIRLKAGSPPPPTPDREAPRRREDGAEPTVAASRAAADAPTGGRRPAERQ
jgi:small subunit ribosomal protein S6